MGRRTARELTMKLLYQMEIQKGSREEQFEMFIEENPLTENDRLYFADVISGVSKNIQYIDGIIEKYSRGWRINRIPKVDLSILRISIYESAFRDDIPFNVSVNEAVEQAKKFSSAESGSFINGILSRIPEIKGLHINSE